jgi:uroporphyrinogen-III synthase
MTEPAPLVAPLSGRRVVVPESRELAMLARLLTAQGAEVLPCPLVDIHDCLDPAPVEAWLRRAIAAPFDDLVLLTGEGLRRLLAAAERIGLHDEFVAALGAMRTITRGPKPARALREIDLEAGLRAVTPTTDGVIATLATEDLHGRRIGVQHYPDNPDEKLVPFLLHAGATVDAVTPYRYADGSDDQRVRDLIGRMVAGEADAIAFTSTPQVRRLLALAGDEQPALLAALSGMVVAAVGPVVANHLRSRDVRVDVMPEESFFMKPLVTALAERLGPKS